jgi:flavodoxin
MKNLIIYASIHHGNTKEIAKVIGKELDAKLISFQNVTEKDLVKSNLIGFGSGIYKGDFHQKLIQFVRTLPVMKGKKLLFFLREE